MKLSAAYNEKFTISKESLFSRAVLCRSINISVKENTLTHLYFRDTYYMFKCVTTCENHDGIPYNQYNLVCFATSSQLLSPKVIDSATALCNEEISQFIRGVINTLFTGEFISPYRVIPKMRGDDYEVVRAL